MKQKLDFVYKKNSNDFVLREIKSDHVAVPITKKINEDDYLVSLNSTAYFIWEKLDGISDLNHICMLLQKETGHNIEIIQNDCIECIDKLEGLGLISRSIDE